MANRYLAALNQKIFSKQGVKRNSSRTGIKDGCDELSGTSILRCFICNCIDYSAIDCNVRPDGGSHGYSRPFERTTTFCQCREIEHERRYRRNSPYPQAVSQSAGKIGKHDIQPHHLGCAVQIKRVLDDANVLKLNSGKKIKVVHKDACLRAEEKNACFTGVGGKARAQLKFCVIQVS